ncbi:hypothetical protein RED71_001694, partial [Campylobacter jejuni]|nr:hypothetical protein [Campylobacter jejuni]
MNKTALTKTYTKDIQNSCLNSKKIVLSLATISFLASCTHATLTPEIETYEETDRRTKARSASRSTKSNNNNETINNSQTLTQTVNNTGNTLVIESSGTITISNVNQQAVNFTQGSSTSTFLNKGTLIGGNNTASVQLGAINNNGVTIETFNNEGIIGNGSSKFGVTVWGTNSSKSTINNFSNSGTIHSNTGESIYFGNANISSFANSGTIKSNQRAGVNISQGTSIENFNNSGTIEGKSMGVNVRSTINTFVNGGLIAATNNGIQINANVKTLKNTGTIKGHAISISLGGTIDQLINEGIIDGSAGIYMRRSLVKTLTNKGTINQNNSATWAAGIKLENNSTIENIINTGSIHSNAFGISVTGGKFETLTIKDGGQVYGKYSAIGVGQSQTLGDLYIDGSPSNGRVSGIYSEEHGILLENNSRTQKIELKNGGIIQGKIDGIRLTDSASLSGKMILSGEGSRVEGGRGAGILNRSGKITGSITIKDGATVTATSNQAIANSGSGSITGGITVSGENTKLQGNIINMGNASIGSDIKIEGGAKV